jgi:3-deoxy-D-manno-octulosonic-acid transferase
VPVHSRAGIVSVALSGMINHYDILYWLGVGAASPYWLIEPRARKKVLGALSERMGKMEARAGNGRAILIHAVSLGEINATRALIERMRQRVPGLEFVVSVTTETGYARGKELYGEVKDVTLVRYPLDFSSAVDGLLDAMRPELVVLMELEVWPNFMRKCERRGIPVLLVNGRVTPGSFKKYKLAKPVIGGMFRRLARVCAQEETYAKRFIELGARADRVSVTGTMKFDTAEITDRVNGQDALAVAVGLKAGEHVWVCGSTGPGEEAIVLQQYKKLLEKFPGLRLAIVPRKKERFDEVADLIARDFPLVRRSISRDDPLMGAAHKGVIPAYESGAVSPVILGDTFGELRKFFALAEVVFVGRTLVDLGAKQHGSDMIEPAALGKPVVVGTFTGNFAEAMSRFVEAKAMKAVSDGERLGEAIGEMLAKPTEATGMGQRAREVVRNEQGATERHVEVILGVMGDKKGKAV